MTEELDPIVKEAAAELRADVEFDPRFDERVMNIVRHEPVPGTLAALWASARRPRELQISPLGALALAAALVVMISGTAVVASWRRSGAEQGAGASAAGTAAVASGVSQVQFVLVMPSARSVALVGDFNDWNPTGLELQRAPSDGVWSITLPLAPGRYRYCFVIDGARWQADPNAPRAVEDDFGRPNSILTVGEHGS